MTHENFQTFNSLYFTLSIRIEEELNKTSIEIKKILIYRFALFNDPMRLFNPGATKGGQFSRPDFIDNER
jgi:hypothetical protein